MKISVMSLFRDSEEYISRTLKQFESMNSINDIEFEYFFYENDSLDSTRDILKNWCDLNNGRLIYEDQGYPKFGSIINLERFILLAYYRNKLKNFLTECSDSEYTIIVDSDLILNNMCVENLIKYRDYNNCAIMTGNSRCPVKSEIFSRSSNSYYDAAPFRDRLGGTAPLFADCPSILNNDLNDWKKGMPIKVQSAFGGIAILRTEYLKQVYWSSHGDGVEHMEFCYRLHEFGDVYSLSSAKCFVADAEVRYDYREYIKASQREKLGIIKKYENIIG